MYIVLFSLSMSSVIFDHPARSKHQHNAIVLMQHPEINDGTPKESSS